MSNYEFFTDEEKLVHYAKLNNVNLNSYKFSTQLKVYEGAEIMLYHYASEGELVIDTVFMCVGLRADIHGIKCTLVDRKTFRIIQIGEFPCEILNKSIVFHTPYRCVMERTLKSTSRGKMMQGLTSSICVMARSNPVHRKAGYSQAISLLRTKDFFTPEELDLAYAKLEMEDC